MKEYLDSEYDDSEKLICRENVWHFYAYFAENAAQALHEFINAAEITDNPSRFLDQWHNPVSSMGIKHFRQIMDALQLLIDYYKLATDHYYYEPFIINGREINFEHGDTDATLLNTLHQFVNILPYLNNRHYVLSKKRYDEEKYHRYSFEELQNLDQTLSKRILPTFVWFANHSIFSPKSFERIYNYPRPLNHERSSYCSSKQWDTALTAMVKSWEWLKNRKPIQSNSEWEDIPNEIYYGLHHFAEYLPEMQND